MKEMEKVVQEEAYLSQGLSAYDAERRAVLDMGDPVETGVSLDAIHRPKMSSYYD